MPKSIKNVYAFFDLSAILIFSILIECFSKIDVILANAPGWFLIIISILDENFELFLPEPQLEL